jgi:hypothetical protein
MQGDAAWASGCDEVFWKRPKKRITRSLDIDGKLAFRSLDTRILLTKQIMNLPLIFSLPVPLQAEIDRGSEERNYYLQQNKN